MQPRVPAMLWCLLLLATVGCSSFDSTWDEHQGTEVQSDLLVGCWEGTWTSAVNQHTGSLRAVVKPLEENRYDIWYYSTYKLGFLPLKFEYSMPVDATLDGDGLRFTGEADLGWLAGGVFHYDGECRDGRFTCDYRSESDHGVFEMTRPPALESE